MFCCKQHNDVAIRNGTSGKIYRVCRDRGTGWAVPCFAPVPGLCGRGWLNFLQIVEIQYWAIKQMPVQNLSFVTVNFGCRSIKSGLQKA